MSILAALPIIGNIIGGPVEKIVEKMDANDRREFEQIMARIEGELSIQRAQIEVNKAEAGHSSVFVAGWRPFIGWSCGAILIASALAGLVAVFYPIPIEGLDALDRVKDMMTPILMGLLGLGGMRSFEKIKGVARNSMI